MGGYHGEHERGESFECYGSIANPMNIIKSWVALPFLVLSIILGSPLESMEASAGVNQIYLGT